MSPLRLLMVSPRFWPHVGDTELVAGNLADEFLRLGAKPTILSCQWGPSWPKSMSVRDVPVIRLQHAPRGGWSTLRYMIDLTRWLRRSRNSFDAVYVLSLRHEAYATLLALAQFHVPVVLRCQEAGAHGDMGWQSTTRFGDRIRARCRQASAIVASSESVLFELKHSGYEAKKIHVIPGGARVGVERAPDHRHRARHFLAEVNQDLATAEYSPVVVWIGKMHDSAVFMPLLKAWRDVAARWPSARLWLIGDGPARSALYAQLIDWELQYQVLMPGSFEDLSDVLLAADVYVSPKPLTGSQLMLEAMSAGLPVIAADSTEARTLVEHQRTGLIVPSQDHGTWVAALSHLCDNPSAAAKLGHAAQQTVQQHYSASEMANRHLELFEKLISAGRA